MHSDAIVMPTTSANCPMKRISAGVSNRGPNACQYTPPSRNGAISSARARQASITVLAPLQVERRDGVPAGVVVDRDRRVERDEVVGREERADADARACRPPTELRARTRSHPSRDQRAHVGHVIDEVGGRVIGCTVSLEHDVRRAQVQRLIGGTEAGAQEAVSADDREASHGQWSAVRTPANSTIVVRSVAVCCSWSALSVS